MHNEGLLHNVRHAVCLAASAASGTSAVNGVVVDTAGFEGVAFHTTLGTAAANNGVKLQQGKLADGSDMADLEGSQILGNNRLIVSQVHRPRERYIRAVVIRGTASTVDAITALVYGAKTIPPTSPGTTTENNVSPAEGTA